MVRHLRYIKATVGFNHATCRANGSAPEDAMRELTAHRELSPRRQTTSASDHTSVRMGVVSGIRYRNNL